MAAEADTACGKICLVTGGTRGIGQEIAHQLARRGAQIIIVGRNPERIENTLAALRAVSHKDRVMGIQADLSTLDGVRHVARVFQENYDRLDLLVNNVGATLLRFQQSADGYEMTWALNYIGHFLLTHLLLDRLKRAARERGEARIIEVTSSMLRFADPRFPRLQSAKGYNGVMAYAQSKLAINMFTRELARRLTGTGVTINAVTPGAVRTDIAGDNGWWAAIAKHILNLFAYPPDVGVEPILRLALSPELRGVNGAYYRRYKRMAIPPEWDRRENAERLWRLSEEMSCLR